MNTTKLRPVSTTPPSIEVTAFSSIADCVKIAQGAQLTVADEVLLTVEKSSLRLDSCIASGQPIYGINTGFGPLAKYKVTRPDYEQNQKNLIYHLASGVGDCFSVEQSRAIMVARLISLSKGYSGVSHLVLSQLTSFLNHEVTPDIPQMGTVGASGDLTPLAHVALALIGEGDVRLNGEPMAAAKALKLKGLRPLTLGPKEGLALVNGTSAMTGVACLNQHYATVLFDSSLQIAAFATEILGGFKEAFNPLFAEARPHPGVKQVIARLGQLFDSSERLRSVDQARPDEALQDAYTLRCIPQHFGAIKDQLSAHGETVKVELNSVSDNPLLSRDPAEEAQIMHGGNFYGQHIAFASDNLANAVISLGVYLERLVARLCNPNLNGGMSAFLSAQHLGPSSGLMGAQVSASALLAEMRTQAIPASIQSVPTNLDNQDINTMGTIAARKTARLIELLGSLVSIAAMTVAQAYELEKKTAVSQTPKAYSPAAEAFFHGIRQHCHFIDKDRSLAKEIKLLKEAFLKQLV